MKRIFILTLFMGIIGSIFAQNTYTINGSIVDSLRSDKLFYVRVGVVTRDSTIDAKLQDTVRNAITPIITIQPQQA